MKAAILRLMTRLHSVTGKLALVALTICAPLHAVYAQSTMAISAGNNQSGQVGTTLGTPLTVSFSGFSYATALEWTVTSGSATFQENGSTDYIDPSIGGAFSSPPGTASAHLVLGATAGPVTIQVTYTSHDVSGAPYPSQSVTFNETSTPPPTNVITISSGNNQSAQTYYELTDPLTVAFSGSSAVTLDWQVTKGQATFQQNGSTQFSQQLTTTAGSTSSVRLDLGGTPGPVKVTATCSAGCTGAQQFVTFDATVTAAPPPLAMTILHGDGQSAPPNTTSSPLVVQLTAQPGFDGPFNVPLEWKIASGTASFTENHGQTYSQIVSLPNLGRGTSPNGRSSETATGQVTIDFGATPGPVDVDVRCQACSAGYALVFRLTITPTSNGALQKISGDNQTGAITSASDLPLVVQLASALTGQTISWSVVSGQATLSANSSLTDQNGQASITFTYGSNAGPVTIEASSPAGKVDFVATAFVATASVAGGNNQTAAIGATLLPFVVQIAPPQTSAKGLSQVPVVWKVLSGSGTLASANTVTDANGQSNNTLTLGITAGTTTVSATVPGMGSVPVVFTANAVGAAAIAPVSGDKQTAAVSTPLQPFIVQVVSNGHAVPGINVNWTVVQGGGTLGSPVSITDSNGQASEVLTLGSTPGTNVVQASLGGLGTVLFSATGANVSPGNSQFTIVSGNNQALTPGISSQPLIVKLVTTQGQPVSGVSVLWSASSDAGKLAAPSTLTDANGQAQNTFTVTLPGSYSVTAQLAGTSTVPALTFSFNNGVANMPSLTPTQLNVANAIDRACPALANMPAQLTPAQTDLLKRCSEVVVASGNNPQQVPTALDQMANNKVLPQNQLANSIQLSQAGNLNTRLAELRQGAQGVSVNGLTYSEGAQTLPLAMLGDMFRTDPKQPEDQVGKDFDRWGFFATGIIERGGADALNARPGFDFHNASITAGVDYRFSDSFVAGGALGYNQSNSSLDQSQGKVDVDGYSVNGYFTWYHNDDFYIEGSLVVDWLNYDLNRNIAYQIADVSGTGTTIVNQSASASPGGQQESISLSIGKDFNRGAWSISPYLRGIYTHLSLDGFNETIDDPNAAGSGLGTSVDSRSINSALAVLGARFSYTTSYDWGVLVPNAVVEWNHNLKNDQQVAVTRFLADPTQTPIVITGDAADENYFNLGLGLNAVLPQGRSGFLLWEHLTGYSGIHENRYSLGIRIEF